MQRFADSLNLPPVWWWGSVAAVALVALIFLAVGSTAAFLICLVCAAGIAALAASAKKPDGTTDRERPTAEGDEAGSTGV
jgi:hypothetical protein